MNRRRAVAWIAARIVTMLLCALVSSDVGSAAPAPGSSPSPPALAPRRDAAPPGTPDPALVIDEALELSGARAALASMEQELRQFVTQFAQAGRLGDAQSVRPIVEREITVDRLRALLVASLRASYDADRFQRLLTLLREPRSRRMTELEVATLNAEPDAMKAYAATAENTEEGRERLRLAERLDTAQQATKGAPDALHGAMQGAARALNEVLPPGQRITPDQLEADRRRLESELEPVVKAALVYTYRQASIDEIVRYLADLETELGQWWVRAQREAVLNAARSVGENAMRAILRARRLPRA